MVHIRSSFWKTLTNVTFNPNDLPKPLRDSHRSWSFFQLESFLTYKAQVGIMILMSIGVTTVNIGVMTIDWGP